MAQKYRKVDPRIWNDEGFARLSTEERLLALWLLTSERVNRCGILIWSPGLASEETGIPKDRIDTVCHTVCHTLNWVQDRGSKTVFLTRWWRYNRPDNPKALQGSLSDLHDIPRHSLKPYLLRAVDDIPAELRQVYLSVLDTVCDTVCHTVCHTVSPQKQKQKQKQEQEVCPQPGSPADVALANPAPILTTTRKPRQRDELFDAIAEVTGSDPSVSGSHIGRLRKLLSAAEPAYSPEEVRAWGNPDFLNSEFGIPHGAKPTLPQMERGIGRIRSPSKPNTAANRPSNRTKGQQLDDYLRSQFTGLE